MKTWTVKVEISGIVAKSKDDAIKKFWERVDDVDIPVNVTVRRVES